MTPGPLYQHDCDKCTYLGTGKVSSLSKKPLDFYVCTAGQWRSFIAREGSSPESYTSGPLFVCEELTRLDRVALVNGLELEPDEESRLFRVLVCMYRHKLNRKDYSDLVALGASFGRGNVMFEEG